MKVGKDVEQEGAEFGPDVVEGRERLTPEVCVNGDSQCETSHSASDEGWNDSRAKESAN